MIKRDGSYLGFSQNVTKVVYKDGTVVQTNADGDSATLVYYGYTLFFTSRIKDPEMAAQGVGLIQRVLRENEKQARKLDSGWVLLGRAYRL